MFAVVQGATPVIKVIHCVSKFADAKGPDELSGCVIGFHGDRSKYGPPSALLLPKINTWGWLKKAKIVDNAAAWEAWLQQDGNSKKFWAPAEGHVEVDLPRMLQIPAVVAKFVMEDTRVAKVVK
jgi:hypothetical protein